MLHTFAILVLVVLIHLCLSSHFDSLVKPFYAFYSSQFIEVNGAKFLIP